MTTALEALRDQLTGLKNAASAITKEQAEEIEIREAIAAEKARHAEEAAKLRQLAIDQAMEGKDPTRFEVLDLGPAGFLVLKAPSKPAYLAYQVRVEKGTKNPTDDATLAADCVEAHYVEATKDGVRSFALSTALIRDMFDAYPLAPTSIGNVGTRLAGFRLQSEAKRGR